MQHYQPDWDAMAETHQIAGNQVTLLQNNAGYFPRLCADIDSAQQSIYMETYIFAADRTGRMVADALQRAATRGLQVRLLLDGFGSAGLPGTWVDNLRVAGVEVQWFRREISPFTFQRNRRRRLLRLHRKLVAIDSKVAFVGGINIVDDMPEQAGFSLPRLDYAARIQGSVAAEIQSTMRHLWGMVAWANFRKRGENLRHMLHRPTQHQTLSGITLVRRDNLRHRHDIENAYLSAIATAQQEIIIANAYFLPGRLFRRALVKAAQRGVRVVLLLQGKVEYRLQHYATHALYDQLLAAGVEIHEYQASYMHAKVAVIDGYWATVGSSNIDPFSLLLAREANLVIKDKGFAGELRRSLLDATARNGIHIDVLQWTKLGIASRWRAQLSYALLRLVVGLLGYRGQSAL